jgi:chorismate lyase/3-hydroxybenzoate synthase
MKEFDSHQDKTLKLKYATPSDIGSYLSQSADRVVCVVGFGSSSHGACSKSSLPVLWIDIPAAESDAVYEVWTSNKPVTQYRNELITGAGNEDVFFGCISAQFVSAEDLSETAQRAYSGIFDFLQRGSYPNLLRVWNYFPGINAIEAGIERYRSFSVGRHEAFARFNRRVEDSPSASVLGSQSGPLVVYFLASRFPGVQIENPRQTSAYNYPRQYGPRSPIFSRATLAFKGGSQTLFISGTASILGHVSVHPGSVVLQVRETLTNICAVIDQAGKEGFKFAGYESGMALKVYVRQPEHMRIVRDIIKEEWGVLPELIVLQADICRSDLLFEVEAVCWGQC